MRISKVSTRKGDKGRTSLGTGERVAKDHPVVEFMGEVDELNSQIGLSIAFCENESLIRELSSIQQDLFNIGGEASLLSSDLNLLKDDRLDFLELNIKKYNENLPPLKEFILPGGNKFCAQLHINRAVSRRVERSCVALSSEGVSVKNWLPYLNRLSDYFFVLARNVSSKKGAKEILWDRS